jgi:hypothetical protein
MRLADQTTQPPDPVTLAALSPTIRTKVADTTFAINPTGEGSPSHYPDVVLITTEGRMAFEIQLVAPGRARLDAILAGYARKPTVTAIIFLIGDPAIRPAIFRAANRARVTDRVYVTRARLNRRGP